MKIGLSKKIALLKSSPRTAWNLLIDRFSNKESAVFPRIVDIFTTEKCNFSCPMCHVGESMRKNYSGADISFECVQKIVNESKKWSPSFQLIGGEPTLYKYLKNTIELISSNRMICGLTTNGLLLESLSHDIVSSGLNFLAVSLDGWDEESQKKRGNVGGSFEKIINGILAVLRYRGKKKFPIVRIATVISKNNYAHLNKIGEIVKKIMPDKWSISNYYFVTGDIVKKNEVFRQKTGIGDDIWADKLGDSVYFSSEEIDTLEKMLLDIRYKYGCAVEIDYNWSIDLKKFYSSESPSKNSICVLPCRELIIRGNGDMELCQGYKLGNIKNRSIHDAWNGKDAHIFRDIFKNNGMMPACFRCCALDMKFQ